jgi:hypothetical protein
MRTGSDETNASNLSVLQIIPARFKTWATRLLGYLLDTQQQLERVFASPITARTARVHAHTHTNTHTHTRWGEGTLYLLF